MDTEQMTNGQAVDTFSFKPENDASIQPAVAELERIYVALVPRFSNLAGLPHPRIVIQTRGRRKYALGWFAPNRWQDARGGTVAHEITLTAEHLARPVPEIVATLVHEMTHLSCCYAGIQDVGKDGRYHNRKFKAAAEAAGLHVEKDMRLGWSLTTLGPELAVYVFSLNVQDTAFAFFRIAEPDREKQPTKMKKWQCDCTIVRCAVDLEAICVKCETRFVCVEKEQAA